MEFLITSFFIAINDPIENVKTETETTAKIVAEVDRDKDGVVKDGEVKLTTEATTQQQAIVKHGSHNLLNKLKK